MGSGKRGLGWFGLRSRLVIVDSITTTRPVVGNCIGLCINVFLDAWTAACGGECVVPLYSWLDLFHCSLKITHCELHTTITLARSIPSYICTNTVSLGLH